MRPVNLIPPEERRDGGISRTGPLSYLVVAVLVLVLGGVTMLVLTGNDISERKSQIAALEQELASTEAQVQALSEFAQFAQAHEARSQTVSSLATSRFDWERVMRELALVIPSDVWLTDLAGSVTPEAGAGLESGGSAASQGIDGPSLTITGCGASHNAVATFAAALRDVDGVTRVGVFNSERDAESGSTDAGGSSGATSSCRTRDFIASFEIVVAFDEAPVSAPAAAPVAPAPAPSGSAGTEAGGDPAAPAQEPSGEQPADPAAQSTSTPAPGA